MFWVDHAHTIPIKEFNMTVIIMLSSNCICCDELYSDCVDTQYVILLTIGM